MIHLSRTQKAHVIIHNAAAAAGGIGAGWLSDLLFVPDVFPLALIQIGMLLWVARLFSLPWARAALGVAVTVFCAGIAGRGASLLLFLRFPEQEALSDILVAIAITELVGWLGYRVCRSAARDWGLLGDEGQEHPAAPAGLPEGLPPPPPGTELSLVTTVLRASKHGPWRVLLSSAPMLLAAAAAFTVPNVGHFVQVRLRAPGGTQALPLPYPLIERHQGGLRISGPLRGTGERILLSVKNDVLADGIERDVLLQRPVPRVRVLAWLPAGRAPGPYAVGPSWDVSVERTSDYWQQVRGRLYLLLIGLLGSLALLRLGERRARAATTPSALLQSSTGRRPAFTPPAPPPGRRG